jgi:hypothetical protein
MSMPTTCPASSKSTTSPSAISFESELALHLFDVAPESDSSVQLHFPLDEIVQYRHAPFDL